MGHFPSEEKRKKFACGVVAHRLLEVLDTYKPLVWEYARLNITHNVLSKRKLNKLVTSNLVHGWDDPRLYTLSGARTPDSVRLFCKRVCF